MKISKLQLQDIRVDNYTSKTEKEMLKKQKHNYQNEEYNRPLRVSLPLLQVYSGVNFKSGKTNYKWMLSTAGYIPLVIAAGLDMTKGVTKAAFPNLECEGGDWTNANMTGVYLKNSQLTNSNFENTQMYNVKLHHSDLSNSKFDGVMAELGRFSHTNFYNTTINDSDFQKANFHDAKFKGAVIKNSNFANANFIGADLSELKSIDDESIFAGAIYDRDTKFSSDFDPVSRGMIKIEKGLNLKLLPDKIQPYLSGISLKPNEEEFPYDLSGTSFSGADMQEAKFEDINFSRSNFEGAIGKSSIFIGCNLSRCTFNEYSDFSGGYFNNSVFFNTKFNGANLAKSNFMSADLSMTDLAELPDNKVAGCIYDLGTSFPPGYDPQEHGLIFAGQNANLSDRKFFHMEGFRSLSNNEPYDFTGAKLNRADFSQAGLENAIFKEANMKEACLKEVIMENADFSGASLYAANLTGGDFYNAKFNNADLRWANLKDANIGGADFTGAKYNRGTKFPEGFSPEEHNMTEIKLQEENKGEVNENILYTKQ